MEKVLKGLFLTKGNRPVYPETLAKFVHGIEGGDSSIKRQVVTELTSSIELQPNVFYVLQNVDTTLAVTLATPTDNTIVNEYMLEFETGATPPSVSFPSEVMFQTPLTVKAEMRYQISIIDNIALYVSAQIVTQ